MRVILAAADLPKLCDGKSPILLIIDNVKNCVYLNQIEKDDGSLVYYLTDFYNHQLRTVHLTAERMAEHIGQTILQLNDYEHLLMDE